MDAPTCTRCRVHCGDAHGLNGNAPGKRDGRGSQRNLRASAALLPPVKLALLDPCAAALDQNDQDNNNQYTSDYLDNHGTVHRNSFFFQQNAG
jgi:hypothetical protein